MSNPIKFLLMALVWGLLYLASYYGCIKDEANYNSVSADTTEVAPTPAAPAADEYSIASILGATSVTTGSLWADELKNLVADYGADPSQLLEVTGQYYGSEAIPPNFANMGLLRAERIKELLVRESEIPAVSIVIAANRIEGEPASSPWDAGNFRFKAAAVAGDDQRAEIIDLDEFTKIILFPYNSSQKDIDKAIDEYLLTVAKRMQQTNEKVTLVGHADDKGQPEYNQKLGQQRADFVKSILVRDGAPAANITTSSRGESDARVPNNSPANRHQNRRVVLTLSK
jgi:outer membrane protein OmpA-like peptidoglycan-associated protein